MQICKFIILYNSSSTRHFLQTFALSSSVYAYMRQLVHTSEIQKTVPTGKGESKGYISAELHTWQPFLSNSAQKNVIWEIKPDTVSWMLLYPVNSWWNKERSKTSYINISVKEHWYQIYSCQYFWINETAIDPLVAIRHLKRKWTINFMDLYCWYLAPFKTADNPTIFSAASATSFRSYLQIAPQFIC